MAYKIVLMVGGSWYPVSKKTFPTYTAAVNYRAKLKGAYSIVESKRVKKTLEQYRKTEAYKRRRKRR